jgi:LDH2 family malate/lactate/ureidoglycolate dehydrogenase
MSQDKVIDIKVDDLHQFCLKMLSAVSVPADEAEIVASSLIEADQRGVRSHGVVCLPRYVSLIRKGYMRSKTAYETVRDYGAITVWDGKRSNGQVLGYLAMKEAVRKARQFGISMVMVRQSNHFGAGAYYAQLAEKEGMIGISASTGSSTMAPWGGAERMIGNNPLAVAVPAGSRDPIVLDMAQSVAAFGRITNLAKQGIQKIPRGWAFDVDGAETEDTSRVYSVIPVGGHKGFGMALVIDILSGILFGGATGDRAGDENDGPSHFFAAINIDSFGSRQDFANAMDSRIKEIKSSRPAKDSRGIFMPGELEFLNYRKSTDSVGIIPEIISDLNSLAKELGVDRCL